MSPDHAEAAYRRIAGDPELPQPADLARQPDGSARLSGASPAPASLADGKDWLELARIDRAMAKLQVSFDERLGEDSEAAPTSPTRAAPYTTRARPSGAGTHRRSPARWQRP
jgi:hypothetical protein